MPRNHRRQRSTNAGFTLIEVLLVLVILVIIGSIAATSIFGVQKRAMVDAAKSQVAAFDNAIEKYQLYASRPPEKLEDLITAPSDKAQADKWEGPYLNKTKLPEDPWGNQYKYAAQGKKNANGHDIWSTGPDGDDQTDDDIGNWQN